MIVPVNVAGYDKVKVSFCMWVEGDAINIGNETVPVMLIQDYGYFEYSFDQVNWTNPDGLYYDTNGANTQVSFNITLSDVSVLDDNIYVRFVWKADAAFCYEGMYIDDVCFVGTIKGETITQPWTEWVWIHDSYDGPITFDEECINNVFPDVWVADEEGTYMICAWLEAIDECHFASTPVDQKYCIVIEIGDILDNELNCTSLDITPSSPAWEGDDITATIEVCNIGTLDETNKQVQMIVNRGSFQIVATDSFEGGTNGPDNVMLRMADSALPLDDYPTQYVTNAETGRTGWHYTTYDSSVGTYGLGNYLEVGPQPWTNPKIPAFASDYVRGPILGTGNEIVPQGMSATYDIKANLGATTDRLMWGVIDVDTGWGSYYSLYGVQWWDWTEFEIDVSSWINDITTSAPSYFGPGDHFSLVWRLNKAAPGIGAPTCPWNNEWKGMMIDNVNIISLVAEEEVIFEQTQIIPFLNITDCVTLTYEWPDAGVGQYVFNFEIITPDSNADNNKCMYAYNIINTMECIDDWTCVDYTGPGQGHWVEESCCGGYFWPGDPATTMYGNNWDDCLYPKNATGGLNFNMVGTACIEFDTWYQISAGDYGLVEYSTDGGIVWWPLASYTGISVGDPFGWFHATLCLPSPGTATTQFRFRFDSNATGVNRGWFVDNIELTLNSATVFGPDPCLDFTKFYRHEKQYGCWWTQPWIEEYASNIGATAPWVYAGYESYFDPSWGCYDKGMFTAVNDTYNARPWYGMYPDNLNTAIIGTIEIPTAFYGWLSATTYYDHLTGDTGYLEVSRDGTTWDILSAFTGASRPTVLLNTRLQNDYVYWDSTPAALGGSPAQHDVSDYLDETELQFRFRFVSSASNTYRMAGFGLIGPVCFFGMSDNNAPVTTAQMTGTFDEDCHWYTSCVKIKLDATDDITGVAHTYYTLDGVQYEYTQLVSICTDGTHTFCYWSVDNEGNVEEKKCLPEFRIDMTGPTVDITGPSPGLYLFGNKIMELKSGKTIFLFNGIPVTATATAADNPVEVVQFFLDDVLMAEDSTAPYSATLSAKHTGPATIKVVAIDGQGRTATDTLNIDNYFKLF